MRVALVVALLVLPAALAMVTAAPSATPTAAPSAAPTARPSAAPTAAPSSHPTPTTGLNVALSPLVRTLPVVWLNPLNVGDGITLMTIPVDLPSTVCDDPSFGGRGTNALERFQYIRTDLGPDRTSLGDAVFYDVVPLTFQLNASDAQVMYHKERDAWVCDATAREWVRTYQYGCDGLPTTARPARLDQANALATVDTCHNSEYLLAEPNAEDECQRNPRLCKNCVTGHYGCSCQHALDSPWLRRSPTSIATSIFYCLFFIAQLWVFYEFLPRVANKRATDGYTFLGIRIRGELDDNGFAAMVLGAGVLGAIFFTARMGGTDYNQFPGTQSDADEVYGYSIAIAWLLALSPLAAGLLRWGWAVFGKQCTAGYEATLRQTAYLLFAFVYCALLLFFALTMWMASYTAQLRNPVGEHRSFSQAYSHLHWSQQGLFATAFLAIGGSWLLTILHTVYSVSKDNRAVADFFVYCAMLVFFIFWFASSIRAPCE